MNDEDFKREVAPEITERWSGRITPAQLTDWHYFLRAFTIQESVELVRKYFRKYDGRGNPRPAEFGGWLKKNQIQTGHRGSVERFAIDATWWPKATAFKVVLSNDNAVRFGWIERKPNTERGHLWTKKGGLYYLECVMPIEVRAFIVSIQAVGQAPDSWLKTSASEAPEGLEKLLTKEKVPF